MTSYPLSFALGLITLGFSPGAAISEGAMDDGKEPAPSLSVSGTGTLSAVPDIAEINVAVETQRETAVEAMEVNAKQMTALQDRLKEHGVASKDVQTSQFSIQAQYSQPPFARVEVKGEAEFVPRVIGYKVTNAVQITARHVSKLGGLLDTLVSSGANQVEGITFRVDQPEKLLDEVRKRAMADAKRKAQILADEAGMILGAPRSIVETSGSPPIHPRMMAAPMMMRAASPTPIQAGAQELSITVSVIYTIRSPK